MGSREERAAKPWKYEACALGPELGDGSTNSNSSPRYSGYCWASRALLYVETKDAPDIGIIAPGCENLFLAGEYISSRFTTIKVPTMEKSAETGAMAARAAMHWLHHERRTMHE